MRIQAKQNVFLLSLFMDRKAITESHTYVECALGESSGRSGPSESLPLPLQLVVAFVS